MNNNVIILGPIFYDISDTITNYHHVSLFILQTYKHLLNIINNNITK